MTKPRYTITFEIPGLPKTINSMGRKHWTVKAKEAATWRSLVVYAVGTKRPAKPLKKAKVTFTRASSQSLDFDGLVSSFKHVQDGLVDAGVIENDKFVNIGSPTYTWEKARLKEGFIRVTVEEVLEDRPSTDPSIPPQLKLKELAEPQFTWSEIYPGNLPEEPKSRKRTASREDHGDGRGVQFVDQRSGGHRTGKLGLGSRSRTAPKEARRLHVAPGAVTPSSRKRPGHSLKRKSA